jgi:exoribonuclease R
MKKLELVKALKDSLLLEKKIKNLEKTLEDHKKLNKESDKEFLINAKNFFKTRSYPYKAFGFCGDYIDHHVIIGGILYTFDGVDKKSQKIILQSGWMKKRHSISLSLDEFLEKTDPVMKSIREKDSFKKGDDVFINDSKFFFAFKKDDGKVFINNGDKKEAHFYRGEILRILENNTAIVLLLFPSWGGPMSLEVLVDLKKLRHTTLIDDIYNRIEENNFVISEMGGFKIGDQICYKNNKTPRYEDEGKFYYDILDYNGIYPLTFKILGFINDKVIVGSYTAYLRDDYKQSFIINDIEEIEKL